MNWATDIRNEFAQRNKTVNESVVEEMAQHAEAAWEAVIARGESSDVAESLVRALITSWCEGTSGPRRSARLPLVESAPAGPPVDALRR